MTPEERAVRLWASGTFLAFLFVLVMYVNKLEAAHQKANAAIIESVRVNLQAIDRNNNEMKTMRSEQEKMYMALEAVVRRKN